MTAVLAMASALDIPGALVCDVMPVLEAELVKAHNREAEDDGRQAGISQDQV